MKVLKHPVCRRRVRRVPPGFNWVDRRLVREHYVERCSHAALALYLFLVTVSDAEGLSYWSEGAIDRRLHLEPERLRAARTERLAYDAPVYQVLDLGGGAS